MNCYLCKSSETKVIADRARDNADLKVLSCRSCGLVFLSSFDHIKDGFYENSGMFGSVPNVATWMRETEMDDQRRFEYSRSLITGKKVLDFGCGNGGFLIKAKQVAESVVGVDLDKSLISHFQAKGIPYFSSLSDVTGSFDVITLFHCLEHMSDPKKLLLNLRSSLSPEGQILIETPNADDALLKLYKCEPFSKFTYWSCHLFLFTAQTLAHLLKQVGAKINYIKHIQRYPLSNHLHWLSRGKPGGHKKWSFIDTPELFNQYEGQLASISMTDTLVANITFPGQ